MSNHHSQTIEQILLNLKSSETGLSTTEAEKRLSEFGKNELPESGAKMNSLKIFLNQWKSPMLWILMIAGAVSGFVGEYVDMGVIFFTATLNALIGFFQENKANRALEKLKEMVEYKTLCLRDQKKTTVKSDLLVPGDIIFLDAGDKIQADGRILEIHDLEINEAVLTGESEPMKKKNIKVREDAPLSERLNMVYRGTVVVNGRAKVLITAIGKETEIGKIAVLIKKTGEEATPLQIQLAKLSRFLGIGVVGICVALFLIGVFARSEHYTVFQMFETAVAVAVGAIPEGLVISLTVILAIGTQYILKRRALVRRLIAAETLGSVTVICTDKTGTLTEGKMRLDRLVTINEEVLWDDLVKIDFKNQTSDFSHFEIEKVFQGAILANDATLINSAMPEDKWQFVGDTTDSACLYAGMKVGLEKEKMEKEWLRTADIPFDSTNKYLAVMYREPNDGSVIFVKGAAEILINQCSYYRDGKIDKKITNKVKEWFLEKEKDLAGKGLRVLAVCYKEKKERMLSLKKEDLSDLTFAGLVVLSDPLRKNVGDALALTASAGIRTIIVTGDHARTAQFIAKELGLPAEDKNVMNGETLEKLSDDELAEAIKRISVFARIDPKHKIRIVQALQAQGEVVAMTGDGVNDAPALKGADIGISLGSATDVAKEIADLVLLDDDFSTIVSAIEEGRRIYGNIKKAVSYLLAGCLVEIVLISTSIIFGMPLVLVPVQILWINLIMDSFPNIALAFEKGDPESMKEKPRKKNESIIDSEMKASFFAISFISIFILFGIFRYFFKTTGDIILTRTIIFVALGLQSLFYVYSVRVPKKMIWQANPFGNTTLNLTVLFSAMLLVSAVYVPFLSRVLRVTPLSFHHWVVIVGFGVVSIVLIELIKGIFLIKQKLPREIKRN